MIPIRKDEKEVIQAQLDNEKAVLKRIEENYKDALEEIVSKIAELLGSSDADLKHVVYQIDFQKNLKKQIEMILETLHSEKFETVSEYLTTCYNEGFLGTLYSLQQQGVPLAFPINQEEVAAAIQLETKLSASLYETFDVKDLQKKIASEISRGFSTGAMYSEIARNVASYARIDKNKAIRIARTEGHRITEAAAYNAQVKAKERGADIVRIWDATLDCKTRPSHMRVDGEIREIGKKFSNGLEFPGDPSGKAAEVINCRCRSRSDARWALEADETKMLGDVSKMSEERKKEIAKKLGVPVDTLDQYSEQIVPVKAKNYADFKKQYNQLWRYEGSALQKEAEERIAGYGKPKEKLRNEGVSEEYFRRAEKNLDGMKPKASNVNWNASIGVDEDTSGAINQIHTELNKHMLQHHTEKAIVYSLNEKTTIEKSGALDEVLLSDEMTKLLKNGAQNSIILAHVHPSGGSFSIEDISKLVYNKSVKVLTLELPNGDKFALERGSFKSNMLGSFKFMNAEREAEMEAKAMFPVFEKYAEGEDPDSLQEELFAIWSDFEDTRNRLLAEKLGMKYMRITGNE